MALQIMCGIIQEGANKRREIQYAEDERTVNVTSILESTCGSYFVEEDFYEADEKIALRVVHKNQFKEMATDIEREVETTMDKLEKVRGQETKRELLNNLKDFSLLNALIIRMLLKYSASEYSVLTMN